VALNAIVFLYKQVLGVELGDFGHIERAKKPKELPVVMTKAEVGSVLAAMSEAYQLPAELCNPPVAGRIPYQGGSRAARP
jgi:hypothetical protein